MAASIHSHTRGVVIAATPFSDSGAVDFDSIDRLTDFYLGFGIDGLTILGIMGEAQKLSQDESLAVMRRFLQRIDGRVPVVRRRVGGGFRPDAAAGACGDGPGCGPRDDRAATDRAPGRAVLQRLRGCRALGPQTPVCLQDYPAVYGVHMSVPVFSQIVRELPQVVMLKAEDSPGLAQDRAHPCARGPRPQRRVSILVGSGSFYPLELARGADGPMTGVAYPEMLTEADRECAPATATAPTTCSRSTCRWCATKPRPASRWSRKEILRRRGAIASAKVRAPGAQLDRDEHDDLTRMMARIAARLAALDGGRAR